MEQSKVTNRPIFCNIYYENKLKITPKGKLTANVRISIIYYLCDVLLRGAIWQKIVAPGSWFLYYPRAQWVALRAQINAVAPVMSRLVDRLYHQDIPTNSPVHSRVNEPELLQETMDNEGFVDNIIYISSDLW